jgi:SAM-dependent methyltransferase
MKPLETIASKINRIFVRIALRGTHYSSNYSKLDTVYMVDDPWHMDSPSEKYRFEETNRLILEKFGRVRSILEVGCGEGHQSVILKNICNHLVGLDVSAKAVARAKRRCPGAVYYVGDISSREIDEFRPYDLVVACEVLYYMNDVSAALRRMQELGRNCFVTYYCREMESLDKWVLSIPGVSSEYFEYENIGWRAAWWSVAPV